MRKQSRSFRLNRETLHRLDRPQLAGVAGGFGTTANPTFCNPNSGCASCDGSCPVTACGTVRTCPP
jgi:hypothetical protein